MVGSAFSILGFIIAPTMIRRFGNYKTAIFLVCLQIFLMYGLISSISPYAIALFFALQMAVISLIGLTIDIFLEVYTDASSVGAVRGFHTAVLNASWVLAPLIGSLLLNGTNNYHSTYVAALAMLFPLLYLIYRNFPRFKDPNYTHLSPWQLIKHISSNTDWTKLFAANVILQTFYSWMVIYSPIYLNKTIGFGWAEIGIIFVVMLIPFPLIQYPLGLLADRKYGEKEMLAIGFAIMGITTMFLSLVTVSSVVLWASLLLLTRIGAASAEIMMEVYFFKTVPTRDSSVLGSFRITRPVSYFLAPLIMMIGLLFTTDQYMFVVIGAMCLVGLIPALTIKDTR
jgi:MFS family permease